MTRVMLVLGINTVADVCEVALVRGGACLAQHSEPMRQGHDARLAPLVEDAMRMAGAEFGDLDRIAVVVGPGSFTGVRVGVAFARGLALALNKPAVGVSSLEALAVGSEERVAAALPAKRRPPEQTWWAQIVMEGKGVTAPAEVDAAGLRALAGQAASVWGAELDAVGLASPPRDARPTAVAAARLASFLPADDLPPARPIYVREPDATPQVRPMGQS